MGEPTLVKFKDNFEEDSTEHFGILFANDCVLCLCCGGTLEQDDYEIIEEYPHDHWHYVDETLMENF